MVADWNNQSSSFSGQNSKKTSSRLVIASVQKSDSGNYTCGTTHAEPSTISVYVSRGESDFIIFIVLKTIIMMYHLFQELASVGV